VAKLPIRIVKKEKMKIAFVDIGELGWSLYLSAHLKWLKKNTDYSVTIITSPDRKCLYKDSTDLILDIPHNFYKKFKGEQSCFGLCSPIREELRGYFQKTLPSGYMIPEGFKFGCDRRFLSNKVVYKPYTYNKKLEGKKKILIFPRHRSSLPFSRRNLPKSFYISLIEILCDEFHDYEIETIGLTSGSYNIEVDKDNYTNKVREKVDLQDVIDECQLAVNAIGSQSVLPKIALLQGVSTFMIGHQQDRHINKENWLKTNAGFYEVAKNSYSNFNFKKCISKIILFIKEKINGS